jgi:hypothetical protein
MRIQLPQQYRLWGGVSYDGYQLWTDHPTQGEKGNIQRLRSPFGVAGDVLWCRETARVIAGRRLNGEIIAGTVLQNEPCAGAWYGLVGGVVDEEVRVRYTDGSESGWIPYPARLATIECGTAIANGCYREAARVFLRVKRVWVERLHDITEADARAEGIIDGGCLNCGNPEPCGCDDPKPDARDGLFELWDSLYPSNKNHPFNIFANPWVWCCEFERLESSPLMGSFFINI